MAKYLHLNYLMKDQTISLPILPVKNTILYPGMEVPFVVGRPNSLLAIEAALKGKQEIAVLAQKDLTVDSPQMADLYSYGCIGVIKSSTKKDESLEVLILGTDRIQLLKVEKSEPFLLGAFQAKPLPQDSNTEFEALHRTIIRQAEEIQHLVARTRIPPLTYLISQSKDPLIQIFALASLLGLDLEREHQILACKSRLEAATILHDYLTHEKQVLVLQRNIAHKIQSKLNKQQREQLLREQLEQIQKELGETDQSQLEIQDLVDKLTHIQLPERVEKIVKKELDTFKKTSKESSNYQLSRTYLEFLIEIPWNKKTDDNLDLAHARKILDQDHFDLEDVKDRIIEQLVVLKLNPKSNAPILCFVGPPGVGKTSLGESIARALGRKFERISLGGLHDEAELRGHRRTYIGAMPGQIIKAIHRSEVNNPVLMLDEIDKIGRDFRGDPSAALMEILDPAQNFSFRDNYLDCPFDLTQVFFITTANTLDTISTPLLDRMEVLELSGYSDHEKLEIAKRYLIPEKIKSTGLTSNQITFSDSAILKIIHRYTREAGLRQLGRSLSQVLRKAAVRLDNKETHSIQIKEETVTKFLGPEKYLLDQVRKILRPGVAVGLAWTPRGGDVLYIEATLLPGGKGLKLTGQLGDIMKESAQAAQSYLWSNAKKMGIDEEKFTNCGLHIHVPEGAIPKDGPSAGITMATAMASLYTNRCMKPSTAMTGELTLSGLVLPIGGLKEKALAAHRAGYKKVIIPRENKKDLAKFCDTLLNEIEFLVVDDLKDVLNYSLVESTKDGNRNQDVQLGALQL